MKIQSSIICITINAILSWSCAASVSLQDSGEHINYIEEIERLNDQRTSYVYLGDSTFISMRPGYGIGVLDVRFDSVSYNRTTSRLYARGVVEKNEPASVIQGAQAFIGEIDTTEAFLYGNNDRRPPDRISYYRIHVNEKCVSGADGELVVSGVIDEKSYLIIANRTDVMKIYHVGGWLKTER